MNRLSTEKRATILGLLVEGMPMRALSRATGVSIKTVTKLLADAGEACVEYHDETVRCFGRHTCRAGQGMERGSRGSGIAEAAHSRSPKHSLAAVAVNGGEALRTVAGLLGLADMLDSAKAGR